MKPRALPNRTAREHLLAAGSIDWLDLQSFVAGVLDSGLAEREMVSAATIGLVGQMLVAGEIVAGDIEGPTFTPWRASPGEMFTRIVAAWPTEYPVLESYVPFELTARGMQLAAELFEREKLAGIPVDDE